MSWGDVPESNNQLNNKKKKKKEQLILSIRAYISPYLPGFLFRTLTSRTKSRVCDRVTEMWNQRTFLVSHNFGYRPGLEATTAGTHARPTRWQNTSLPPSLPTYLVRTVQVHMKVLGGGSLSG